MSDADWIAEYRSAYQSANGKEPPNIIRVSPGWYAFSDYVNRRHRRSEIEAMTSRLLTMPSKPALHFTK